MRINGNELMAEIGRSRETAQGILSNGFFIRNAHERAHQTDCCAVPTVAREISDTCQIVDRYLFGNRIRWVIKVLRGK